MNKDVCFWQLFYGYEGIQFQYEVDILVGRWEREKKVGVVLWYGVVGFVSFGVYFI